MSAQRTGRERSAPRAEVPLRRPDMTALHARRREARRRVRVARIDLGLGLLFAVLLWVLTPGLAIAALIGGAVLLACVASVVTERRRAKRADLDAPEIETRRRRPRPASRTDALGAEATAVERPRSTR